MNESKMIYQLTFEFPGEGWARETVAYRRMARYGRWLAGNWWKPAPSQAHDAKKRIEREGFIVMAEKEVKCEREQDE